MFMSVHFKICLYMPVAPPTDKKNSINNSNTYINTRFLKGITVEKV